METNKFGHPEGTIEAKFGIIRYVVSSGAFVCLSNTNVFTLHGVEYKRLSHRLKLNGGQWERESYHFPTMARAFSPRAWVDDWNGRNFVDPSRAALAAVDTELVKVWSEFAASHPEILKEGHIAQANSAYESSLAKVNEIQEKLDEAKRESRQLHADLNKAKAS